MPRLLQELRSALRATRQNRFVTTLVVLAFALGIGVTTAVFSVFSGVLLDPLPYPKPDELVVVYVTLEQSSFAAMTSVIRTRGDDPMSVMPSVRRIVSGIDPSLPISQVQTMEQVVADSVGQPRLMSALTGLFGVLAALLAMVGVYGVMAYNVRRQRREFGIRLALGANRSTIRRLVVGRGLWLGGAGIAIGGGGAWLLTGFLNALLHDVQPTDVTVFAAAAGALLVVAVLASYLPARSAGRVDPMIILRDT